MPICNSVELKQELLNNKTYWKFTQFLRADYLAHKSYDEEYQVIKAQMNLDEVSEMLCDISPAEFKACQQIYNNSRKKVKTLKKHIRNWMKKGNVYFLTLTFTDDILSSTLPKTRRDYVLRFLGSLDCYYAANIDFSDSGREHYHAVICTGIELSASIIQVNEKNVVRYSIQDQWEARAGFLHCQGPICSDEDFGDSERLAKYVAKLSNHALKASALSNSILYSRKVPTWAERG